MEKPAELSIAIMNFVLAKLDLSGTDTVRLWSDSGPHYRAYKYLGTAGMDVCEEYGVDSDVCLGPAAHWKGLCDGKFAHMNAALAQAVTAKDVLGIDDYLVVLEDLRRALKV